MNGPKHILVIDDEGAVRKSCVRIFEDAGIGVETVGTADDAFPILSRDEFDAVVLDMMMPGIHGTEALREIEQRLWPDLSVIVITGYATLDMERESLEAGAAAWLSKPFGPDELMAALDEAMRE